jgi:hypothetical protein
MRGISLVCDNTGSRRRAFLRSSYLSNSRIVPEIAVISYMDTLAQFDTLRHIFYANLLNKMRVLLITENLI